MLIKRDVDGKAQSFPNGEIPAVIGTFTYTAKRMGGAPSITATIYYPTPLDKRWTHEEYVEFQGERYYATSIPSSSKDNQSVLYKHDVTFTSRREILDNTLFFDAVSNKDEDTKGGDKYRTNQTRFSFGGDITEFVSRINSSMKYCDVPYSVVIDDGYATTDVKEVSFENQYLTEVLQLINTTYQLDYYWVGNVCHVGKLQYDLTDNPIEYGRNDALVSVSKGNSNARIVDMITGYGSSDNIPYYYPNDDEFGKVLFDTENFDKALVTNVSLGKLLKWDSNIYGKTLTLCKNTSESYQGDIFNQSKYNVCVSENVAHIADAISSGVGLGSKNVTPTCSLGEKVITGFGSRDTTALVGSSIIWLLFEFNGNAGDTIRLDGLSFSSSEAAGSNRLGLEFKYEQVCYVGEGMDMDAAFAAMSSAYVATIKRDDNGYYTKDELPSSRYWAFGDSIGSEFSDYTKSYDKTCTLIKSGKMVVVIGCKVTATNINVAKGTRKMSTVTTTVTGDVLYSHKPQSVYFFENEDGGTIAYDESGIGINDIDSIPNKSLSFVFDGTDWNASRGNADKASKIRVNGRTWIFPSQNLMPSVYRESGGAERFYYAKNDTYSIPGATDKYTFKNIYKEGNPHQGSVEFSDIKPTINGVRNDVIQSDGLGQLFGEIAGVAFDSNDSDVKNDDSEYIHSYFYIKLHKFSGSYGFDLFKHALASESAKINLIKSNGCPACSFDIQCVPSKDKSKMYNCVSTDGHGNLKSVRDDCNDYIFKNDEDAYKDTFNQDSTKTELWIAVKKDDSTLGIIMPNASGNFKPQKGDLFVITGINPPKELVTAAEKRLDEALIKYMSENNEDKFNYSVKFSRIFLQENMAFANKLNENSKVAITYAGEKHEFFVTNYTVKVDDSALADVEIELSDTLDASSSELKKAIDAVKGETVAQLQGLIGGSGGLNATVADRLYLSKQGDDTAQGLITFAKGLVAKAVANLQKGAKFGNNAFITELGNAALNTVRSIDYDNAAEQGFSIEKDAGGRYQAFLTNLTVWGKAVFHELEIRKLSYAGGDIYLSGAGSKIIRVVPVKRGTATSGTSSTVTWVACDADDKDCVGWKCWLLADDGTTATMNYWQEGDQARCRTMGEIISSGSYENTANRSYWRTIPDGGVSTENEKIYGKKVETYTDADGKEQTRETEVELYDGQQFAWIVIGKHSAVFDGVTEGDTHTMDLQGIPQAGDTIVLDGNRHRGTDGLYDKKDRQNVITLETTGDYAPRIACFANITEYKHTVTRDGKEVSLSVFETSPKGGTRINSSMFEFVADDGSMANILNYRGDWSASSTYHKNDQVNHNNAVWVCVANSGVDVKGEEPSDTSSYWKKVLTGGKGEKGDPGTPGKQGDGVVMAYKHADTQPDAPTGTDPEYPGDGWSLSPDAATAGEKVTDVKYGGYESGTYDGTNKGTDATAKEWTEAEDDGRTWMKSPSGLGDNFGYALMKVSFTTQYDNTTVDVEIKAYSEQNYDLVEVWALDTAPDTGTTFRGQGLAHASGNGVEQAYSFTVAKAGRHFICVTYAKDISGNDNGDYGLFRLDLSDNEVAVSDTVWMSQAKVSGGKCVLPWSTPVKINGADGIGAFEILCDPETIVIDTGDNGLATGLDNAYASLMCLRDGKEVSGVTYKKGLCMNCGATVNTDTGVVTITSVRKQSVTVDGQTVEVSCTSGSVTVMATDPTTKTTYVKTIPFSVDVAKFNGGLKADNKTLKSQYKELTNNGSITDLKEYRSEILQSAREISLHVSEKRAGRRNLLVGSACRKYGDGFTYMSGSETQYYDGYPLEQIEINSGIDGVNCIHCRTKRTGTDSYHLSGFSWNGISPQGNIKLEKGKNYVLSFYAKTPTPNDIYFIAEVLYQGSKIDTSRPAKYDGPTGHSTTFSVSEANKWELFTVKVSVPSNAKYEYEEINIFARVVQSDFFVDGYICKPMLEEGEEYNGWTLSEQDYDYVGGNLLDGTGTLTKTGNVEVLDETAVNQGGYNNESASVVAKLPPTTLIGDFLQYSTKDMGLKVGEDCVLSFYARAASGYAHGGLQCYLYSPSTGNVMTESSHEKLDFLYNPGDGDLYTRITPTTAWKRYWVHWRPMGNVPQHILFRLVRPGTYKESYDPSTSYNVGDVVLYGGTYYVCQKAGSGYEPGASSYWEATVFAIEIARPKLEVGATMTEWTAKRADMVDKQALYATGINIDSKEIILTASNTKFRDNDGKEMAVIDHDGLRATKIATTDNGGGHTEISGNTTVWYNKDGVTPGIKVFYDAAGVPHFQFCNSEGKVMYDFGPSGLQSFISSTQQAYSDVAYLRSVSGGFKWVYVPKNVDADKRFVWRKQIPTTEASSHYEIYDGCVFTKEYYNTANSVNWPKPAFLLPDGWYVKPNDGNLPMKIRPADDEGVLDPTKTVYYQTFCYYSGGRVSRMVRAYMTRNFNTSDPYNRFSYNGSYDEML